MADSKKPWVVKTIDQDTTPDKLEDLLNQLAVDGYEVVRIDDAKMWFRYGELSLGRIRKEVIRVIARLKGGA